MANRFAKRGTVRVDLTEGDWIEIKAELTYGEEQHLASVGLTSMRETSDGKGEIGINWGALNLAKISTWVTDWSFEDDAGKRIPVDAGAVRNLNREAATEVLNAIDKYEADQDELKNSSSQPTKTENVEVLVSSEQPAKTK